MIRSGIRIKPQVTQVRMSSMARIGRFAVKSASLVLLFVAVLAWPVTAAAPTAKPEDVGFSAERLQRISDLVQRHITAGSFSGAVTLVARNGRVARLEAQGLMDIESNKPMQKDTIFQIMSMTKPVVGVSIMMMIEEGKVRLTDPVSKFIPEFKNLKVAVPMGGGPGAAPAGGRGAAAAAAEPRYYTVPAEREITIRDLLTHTSGLASGGLSGTEARKVALKGKESLADYIPRLGGVPLDFQPGSRWAYSAQAGFDTLARVVEVVSGMPYGQFARTRIFEPLGMKDTFFYPLEGNTRLASRYTRPSDGGPLQKAAGFANFQNGVYFSGGGGLASTAEDYFQFAQMLLNGGHLNGKVLLSRRTVEMMGSVHAPDTLPGRPRGEGYGLSMRVVNDPVGRNTFLSQGSFGWSGAYGTHFWIDPKEKIVGVLMAQTSNNEIRGDFENAVMYALVGGGAAGTGTN
jgi:CubicO group peptidase (beta-lactamase class C family)